MSPEFQIQGTRIAAETQGYIIAEIGVNHGGDLALAVDLIWRALRSGANAVKFQVYKADTLAHPKSPTYFEQTGAVAETQHAFFRRYDRFDRPQYEAIAAVARDAGIHFLATPFDVRDVYWLNDLVPAWKIASADITNLPLLDVVAATGKPVILSTGAATLEEVSRAVERLPRVALLHCVLAYPTPRDYAQLLSIQVLQRHFPGCVVGYSDHTVATEDMEVCVAAYYCGARILEKHFTDDKDRPGNDHYHSMDFADLARLRVNLCYAHELMGHAEKTVLPIEASARQYARRGLYAAHALAAGHVVQRNDLALLRPIAGIAVEDLPRVVGRVIHRPMQAGDPLTWEHLAA